MIWPIDAMLYYYSLAKDFSKMKNDSICIQDTYVYRTLFKDIFQQKKFMNTISRSEYHGIKHSLNVSKYKTTIHITFICLQKYFASQWLYLRWNILIDSDKVWVDKTKRQQMFASVLFFLSGWDIWSIRKKINVILIKFYKV